jgi:hypothetical protein
MSIYPAGSTYEVDLLLDFSILENGPTVHFWWLVAGADLGHSRWARRTLGGLPFGFGRCPCGRESSSGRDFLVSHGCAPSMHLSVKMPKAAGVGAIVDDLISVGGQQLRSPL